MNGKKTGDLIELRLAPEARVHRIGRLRVEKRVLLHVPYNLTVRSLDDGWFKRSDKAAPRVLEIPTIAEVEQLLYGVIEIARGLAGRFGSHR